MTPHIEPCPYCGYECHLARNSLVRCGACYYCSGTRLAPAKNIDHHNRVSAAAHAAPRHVDHQPLHEAYRSLMAAHTGLLRQLAIMLEVNRGLRDEYAEDRALLEEIQQLARKQVKWIRDENPQVMNGLLMGLHAVILGIEYRDTPPTPEDAPQSIERDPSTKGATDACSSQGRQGEVQEGDPDMCWAGWRSNGGTWCKR